MQNRSHRTPAVLGVALLLTAGCQTTLGNYFANRGQDFADCFLIQTGVGLGLGGHVKAAGLAHGDIGVSAYLPFASLGIVYGDGRPTRVAAHFSGEVEMGLPIGFLLGNTLHQSLSIAGGPAHGCFGILPAVLSWVSSDIGVDLSDEVYTWWLWRRAPPPEASPYTDLADDLRWSRVHAFDIEAGVFALIIGARVGFSPGEFLDFLLGWVEIDIAGDDTRFYVDVLEDDDASPRIWKDAAEEAASRGDLRAVSPLLRGLGHPKRALAAQEAIRSMGDVAVDKLIAVLENPRTNPRWKSVARTLLEQLIESEELPLEARWKILAFQQSEEDSESP